MRRALRLWPDLFLCFVQPLNVLRSFQSQPIMKRKAIAVVRKAEPPPFIPPQYVPSSVTCGVAPGTVSSSSAPDVRQGFDREPNRTSGSCSAERNAPAGQSRVQSTQRTPLIGEGFSHFVKHLILNLEIERGALSSQPECTFLQSMHHKNDFEYYPFCKTG